MGRIGIIKMTVPNFCPACLRRVDRVGELCSQECMSKARCNLGAEFEKQIKEEKWSVAKIQNLPTDGSSFREHRRMPLGFPRTTIEGISNHYGRNSAYVQSAAQTFFKPENLYIDSDDLSAFEVQCCQVGNKWQYLNAHSVPASFYASPKALIDLMPIWFTKGSLEIDELLRKLQPKLNYDSVAPAISISLQFTNNDDKSHWVHPVMVGIALW